MTHPAARAPATAARAASAPAERAPQPAPPLIGPTGVPGLDCAADTINSTFAPFRNAPPPEQGAAGYVAQGIGGVVGLIGMPQQLIDSAFAGFTAPIAALFPSMPAITLLGMHVGALHAHSHPPSLVPPAPPVPLPSIGMLVGAGSVTVLGSGMPLARAGDIGISVTCGSLAPPFEVYTGSSNVFVGGARAARILDITKHCNPTSMGPFDIAMGAAGAVAGAAGAIATGSAGAAAQAAADAAVLAFKLLCGKDPGLPPGMGALLGPPLPTVLIGGFPCPPIGDMAVGALMKGLKAIARAVRRLASRRGNAHCANGSHPIYLVTGENFDQFTDFVSSGLFCWKRHYTTARAHRSGPLGSGFRHFWQRRLDVRLHKITFEDWDGVELEFPGFRRGEQVVRAHGYVLRRITPERYELSTRGEPTMVFAGDLFTEVLPLVSVRGPKSELDFEYDAQRRLVAVDERSFASNQRVHYALRYDAAGRITQIDELGSRDPVARFAASYTRAGELQFVRAADNGLWTHEYDAYHRWTRQVDPRGYGYTFRYDEQGRCVHARGDDGLWEATVEYVPEDKLTRYTEGAGATWIYHYDNDGFITKIVNPAGGVRQRIRDEQGRILADIDPGGRKLEFRYDADGAPLARVDRFGYLHPPEHQAPRLGDPFARKLPKTALERSFAGQLAPTREAAYGATGHLLEIPAELHPLARSTFRMRDANAPTTEAREWTDPLGRRIQAVDELGRVRRWQYDQSGNELARLDRDGRVHRSEVSSWNLLGASIDPLGNTTRYRYDNIEQMVALTDPLGNLSEWTYDLCQRLIAVSRHGRVRDRYEYDDRDRLVAKLDGDGQPIFRNVEWRDNQLVARRVLSSGGEHRFDYDRRGRLREASTDQHEVLLTHDLRGMRVRDQRDGLGLVRQREPGVEHVQLFDRFEYRCIRARDGSLELVAPNGAKTRVRHARDGVVLRECSNGTREWLQYDHEGRLEGRLTARRDARGQHRGWSVRYAYSNEGDLLSVTDSARGLTRYEVDEAHRLVATVVSNGERERYEFDAASNLVRARSFSRLSLLPGNRVDATATEVFEHDSRDRIAVRRHRDGPVVRYFYDSLDMLIRVDLSSRRPAAEGEHDSKQQTWRAAHDAIGRRLWCEGPSGRREFYWDGDRLAAELDPTGKLRIFLYTGHDALVPFAFIDYADREADPASGRLHHVFCDGAGMPLHIEDERMQIVWWASRVDPWGLVDIHEGATLEYNLRWPGHYFDADTGLHYNRYRYYDPALGRYLTQDPIGYRGSEVNLYAYASNPLVHVDVLGLTHSGRDDPNDSSNPRPTDGDGAEHPPPGPRRGPDGLVDRDEAIAMAMQRGNQERETVKAKIAAGEIPIDDQPACVAGVVDRRTGDVFGAHNQPKTAVADPESFHPLLQDRVAQQQERLAAGEDHFSEPGTHAEVLALDQALKARQEQQPDVPLTEADLAEFVQVPMWSREGLRGREPGTPAACCGHCAPITAGTDNISGNAPRFTGGPDNWHRVE